MNKYNQIYSHFMPIYFQENAALQDLKGKQIIIMIIKSIKRAYRLLSTSLYPSSSTNQPTYAPPPSQCDNFKEYLQNISDTSAREKAANLLAQLEVDEELYRENLLQLNKEYQEKAQLNPQVARVLERTMELEENIEIQIASNREVEARHYKAVEHNKTYGIIRIAKEIIQTADHLRQAINILQTSGSQSKAQQIAELTRVQIELGKVFGKYEISEVNPLNEPFDPKEHESIGSIETEEEGLKNRVAQVKRTGFKIKDKLLRPASVIIYM